VVDIDLKAFFDQVNHDKLRNLVGRKIRDKTILKLIGKYLRAPMQRAGKKEARDKGTPQGGPLSPLLANIYLDPLDKELEKRGLAFVPYADNIDIFASSQRSAERILENVVKWLWWNYFQLAERQWNVKDLSGWIRRVGGAEGAPADEAPRNQRPGMPVTLQHLRKIANHDRSRVSYRQHERDQSPRIGPKWLRSDPAFTRS
jgi:hypothetical protein